MNYSHRFNFSLAVLFVAAVCFSMSAAAAMQSTTERTFSGKVGDKYRVQMRLKRDGGTLSGTYFYERVRQELTLRGEIDAKGNFTLREYDAAGTNTGLFKGAWKPSDCEGCGEYLFGNWSKPDGLKPQPFRLTVFAVEFRGPLALVTKSFAEKNRKGEPTYEISVEYPQLDGSTNPNITRFNEMIRSKVMKDTATYRDDFRGGYKGSEFYLSYGVGLANDDLISIDLIYYFYYGGAGQRNAISETLNYDLKNGRVLKFEELFRPGTNYEKLLTDYCVRDLKRHYADEQSMTDETIRLHVDNVVGDDTKWIITPDGLDFIFDSSEIGPPGAGEANVIVPYKSLRQVINRDGPLSRLVK